MRHSLKTAIAMGFAAMNMGGFEPGRFDSIANAGVKPKTQVKPALPAPTALPEMPTAATPVASTPPLNLPAVPDMEFDRSGVKIPGVTIPEGTPTAGQNTAVTGQPAPGSLPAQVQDAAWAQNQLLTNPGGGMSNPFLQMGGQLIGGMNQLNPATQMVQNQLLAQAFNTGGNDTILQALQAVNSPFMPANEETADYLHNLFQGDALDMPGMRGSLDAVNRQVNRQLNEQTIPGVQDQAIGAGQFGSSRQGVSEGIARRGAQDAIADATARITLQAAEQQRTQQQEVMSQLMGLTSQQNLTSGNILSGAFGTGMGTAGQALQGQRGADIAQGQTGANLLGNLYGTNIEAQLRALALAPQTGQFGTMPSQLVGQVGDAQQQHQQQLINEALERFYSYQNVDNAQLQQYLANLGVISPMSGGQGSSAGGGPSKGASALGGAATGAALGSQIYPGWGTAIGAVAGGMMGAFG